MNYTSYYLQTRTIEPYRPTIDTTKRTMNYSREQLANFRAAYESLSVVGPEWKLPDLTPCTKPVGRYSAIMITYADKTQSILAWAKELDIPFATIYNRKTREPKQGAKYWLKVGSHREPNK